MSIFSAYSRYYDLLNHDKDYAGDARYVFDLLTRHAPGARHVVETGCGTGGHACELAALGLDVHGVDISAGMLEMAEQKRSSLAPELAHRLRFTQGDLRTVRLGERADAVISLFHVMSYQTSNADLTAAFATAREHLAEGGVFIFDCWGRAGGAHRAAGGAGQATGECRPLGYANRQTGDECGGEHR